MEVVLAIVGFVFVAGVGLALHEWRKGKTLLKHDLSRDAGMTGDTRRDIERARSDHFDI